MLLQFGYFTDVGVALRGWEVTDVQVGGTPIEAADFTTDTWLRVDGRTTTMSDNYYIAEYRTHDGSDALLKNCYQANSLYDNWVDWFSYNRGLHLIYRDTFWQDSDVASHIGEGGWQVIDARPIPDGVAYGETVGYWRPRIQVRDAAFSVKRTPSQSIWFHGLRRRRGRGRQRRPRQDRAALVQRRVDLLVPRVAGGRDEDPEEPRRAHPGQEHERRRHDDLGGQQEVTR